MADEQDRTYPVMTVDELTYVRRLTLQILANRGTEAVFTDSGDTVRCANGSSYNLDNLVRICRNAPRHDWPTLVDRHFASMLAARDRPDFEAMALPELLAQVRSRVLSTAQVESSPGGMLSYGWPVSDGLTEVLCIDYPDVIAYINSSQIATSDVGQVRAAGRRNTAAEPIDQVVSHRLDNAEFLILSGASAFVGSKILDIGALVPKHLSAEPHGYVVGAPSRNLLVAHRVQAAESLLAAVSSMALACRTLAAGNPGPISGDLYYWNGDLQRITSVNPETDAVAVHADGAFGDTLNALLR